MHCATGQRVKDSAASHRCHRKPPSAQDSGRTAAGQRQDCSTGSAAGSGLSTRTTTSCWLLLLPEPKHAGAQSKTRARRGQSDWTDRLTGELGVGGEMGAAGVIDTAGFRRRRHLRRWRGWRGGGATGWGGLVVGGGVGVRVGLGCHWEQHNARERSSSWAWVPGVAAVAGTMRRRSGDPDPISPGM